MIKAENITKSFGSVQVLRGISMEVSDGEIVSVVGASGAGKSTLLQILGTLERPDGGLIWIDGENPLEMDDKALCSLRNRKIGFVFQEHRLLPEFSALENVMMPALIGGESKKSSREKALLLLETVGLGERVDHKPAALSGGERQRAAIARALVNSPAILLADEPSGNLDSRTKEEIHSLFFSLRERLGQTMVIVTHDEGLAQMCDRCLVMQDGLFV